MSFSLFWPQKFPNLHLWETHHHPKWPQAPGGDPEQAHLHCTPHLQCMLLCIQKYDFTIQYKPGKEMILADCLNRFPSHNENLPIELYQNIENTGFSTDRLNIIQGAIEWDPIPQHPLLSDPGQMARMHTPDPVNCLTLLGCQRESVHWRWPTHQR